MRTLMTKAEVAQKFNLKETTVDAWRRSGRLSYVRFNKRVFRYRPEEVEKLVEECTVRGWF